MNAQVSLLLFFQKIANPVLDKLAVFFTLFGEGTISICVMLAILWCIDKRKGFAIAGTVFSGLTGMSIMKAIVRMPRPFTVIPELAAKRISTATGYSFPSGHTTTAATLYTSLAMAVKKRWFSIICAALILMVGLSRMYLGVHWPLDVAGGLILGILTSLFFYRMFASMEETAQAQYSVIIGTASLITGIILAVLLFAGRIDDTAFSDMMKNFALFGGAYLGFFWDAKRIHFSTEGSLVQKLLRFILGFAVVLGIMALKHLVSDPPGYYLMACFRYALTGLWATALHPYIGKKLRLFS